MYRLRLERRINYDSVYLSEHRQEEEVDMDNLSFLYLLIREKMNPK